MINKQSRSRLPIRSHESAAQRSHLCRIRRLLTTDVAPTRLDVDLSADPPLADRVADNLDKLGIPESETLLVGTGFGITPYLTFGPNGSIYMVSLSRGAIYRIGAPV